MQKNTPYGSHSVIRETLVNIHEQVTSYQGIGKETYLKTPTERTTCLVFASTYLVSPNPPGGNWAKATVRPTTKNSAVVKPMVFIWCWPRLGKILIYIQNMPQKTIAVVIADPLFIFHMTSTWACLSFQKR